jgi:phosphatidylcholine synthase
MTRARLIAWGVHLYTAVGGVVALLALDAVYRDLYGTAFAWMVLAFILDSTDGTLARRVRVKQVVPEFDGARLDDIVDYLNYVFVPAALALHAGLLPAGGWGIGVAALPLLASAYGFCQTSAKTADHFFTGFPSYWNVVVLYLYVLDAPLWFNVGVLAILSMLVFVPIRYLYPSRATKARKRTYLLAILWGVTVIWLVLQFPSPSRRLAIASLFFPAYYMAMSLRLHLTSPPSPRMTSDEQ